MNNARIMRFLLSAALVIGFSTGAFGQATRTWVSGVGDDANPCSRTAPCKTFAGAISKTANGGEIDALDPGGFGAVTITKAITIDGTGTFASILNSATNGINVNVTTAPPAGGTVTVNIRGLSINGAGTTLGLNGINYILGANLNVLDCFIQQQSGDGIHYGMSTSSTAYVRNTVIKNCLSDGVDISTTAGTAKMAMDHSGMAECGNGMNVKGNAVVEASESVATGNTQVGFTTSASGAAMNLERCVSTHNGTGLNVSAGASMAIGNTSVTANTTLATITGQLFTFKNNNVAGGTLSPVTPINPQ